MDDTPLNDLKLTPSDFLDELDKRTPCKKCNKSRKYYCYTCFLPLPGTEDRIPKVTLPVKVDVIKHRNERDGKSTAAHAAVVASDDVKIYTYPVIPDYSKSEKVVLVYPGDDAVSLEELAKLSFSEFRKDIDAIKDHQNVRESGETVAETNLTLDEAIIEGKSQLHHKEEESRTEILERPPAKRSCNDSADVCSKRAKVSSASSRPFDKVVFIDSTWSQTKKIYDDERIKDLPQIKLSTQKTIFWRHQKDKPDTYLATIEAIYYFFREYHDLFVSERYNGEYDDLLFFFCLMYKQTRELYDGGRNIKAYKDRESRGVMM